MGFWSFVYEMYIMSILVDKNLWQQIPNQISDPKLKQKNEMMFNMSKASFTLLPLFIPLDQPNAPSPSAHQCSVGGSALFPPQLSHIQINVFQLTDSVQWDTSFFA